MTEQEIINRYDKLLWKHVHNFKGRCKGTTIPDEDLIQAARMAFLEHIRTHKPEEWSRCGFTILHALCDEARHTVSHGYKPCKGDQGGGWTQGAGNTGRDPVRGGSHFSGMYAAGQSEKAGVYKPGGRAKAWQVRYMGELYA